jgi:hypothetical protein
VVAAIVVLAGGRAQPVATHAAELHATPVSAPAPAVGPVVTPLPAPAPTPVPTLDVRVTPATARVTVDGAAAQLKRGRLVRPVAAGAHTVHAEAPGMAPYDRAIDVSGTVVLDVVLARASTSRRTTPAARAAGATPAPGTSPTPAADSAPAPTPTAPTPTAPPPIDPNGTIEPFQ